MCTLFTGVSFNLPKLGSNATWNASAVTVADESIVGRHPTGIFSTTNNTFHVTDQQHGRLIIWPDGLSTMRETLLTQAFSSMSVFVTEHNEMFVDNAGVDRWTRNSTNGSRVMHVNGSCTGLFVDTADRLYCSSATHHQVFRQRLGDGVIIGVAGTGCPGPAANMLDHPHGIFVDSSFSLFVADSHNNRIQRFLFDQPDAVTVAGFGASTTLMLNKPSSVILDGDGNMFIVDSGNHRVVRSVAHGLECLFGCSGRSGSSASELNSPHAVAFDRDGNLLVTDFGNHRVQQFLFNKYQSREYCDLIVEGEGCANKYR